MTTIDLRPQNIDLYVIAGDTLEFNLGFVDTNGSLVDLDGYEVTAQARRYPAASGYVEMDVATLAGGTASFAIPGSVTSTMEGSWRWACQLVSESSGSVRTPADGSLNVLQDTNRG